MSHDKGWIGVDLDGTLAEYDFWRGPTHIGEPIEPMLARIKEWVSSGQEVRIFTARAYGPASGSSVHAIKQWLLKHGLPQLSVTCIKDYEMRELWDDRAVQVIPNTGRRVDGRD